MKSLEEIKEFYYSNLKESLDEFEIKRKTSKKNVIIRMIAFSVVFFVLVFMNLRSIFYSFGEGDALQILFFVYAVGASLVYYYSTKDYSASFKDKIIEPLIKSIDDSFIYKKNAHISKAIFKKAELIKGVDRLSGDDYVSGNIDGVEIEFSDLHAQERRTKKDGKTYYVTCFKGLFIKAQFNKNFHGKTVVLPDTAQNLFGSLLGNWLQSKNLARDELIKMDNTEFEKEFVVYGTDQIEARYILTPMMMQRLLDFKKKSKYPIYISFIDNCIYIAVYNNKDHFEATLFSSLLDYEVAKEYISNLHLVSALVDDLKLNEKLWDKK